MKRVFFLILIALLATGAAVAEPAAAAGKALPSKTFQMKFKAVESAAALIKPLLSSEGSVSTESANGTLSVSDKPANLAAIAAALQEFDVAPRSLKLSIRLVLAGRGGAGARMPEEARDLSTELSMLGFTSAEPLGQADIEGHEGESAAVEMANGYRAAFKFGDYDPTSKTVSVSDLHVSKLTTDHATKDLYRTTLNLKVGQTYLFATTRKGEKALVIVMAVRK